MLHKRLVAAVATAALLGGLVATTEVAQAQFHGGANFGGGGFRGGGFGGGFGHGGFGGFRGGIASGGWRGANFGGFRGGWGGGWGGRHWGGGWGYNRPWRPYYRRAYWGGGWPWYGAGLVGAGLGWGWPYYFNAGYYGDSCYRLRRVWTSWGWRRQWVNVCDGWNYSGAGYNGWGGGWGAGWGWGGW